MKPLFTIVVALMVLAASAHPENIEEVKQLPQTKEPTVEAEESDAQARVERCTTCSNSLKLISPKDVLAAIQAHPGAEVHTQQSFEGCSSDKGCAGLKVKDGRVIERFGNLDAFRAAAAADTANEFSFHPAGNFGLNGETPFWWMNNQNSPFKNTEGGSFEKFSKSSSSSYSTTGNAAGLDLSANPFLNGAAGGFSGATGAGFSGATGAGFSGAAGAGQAKPSSFQSSSFESSSFSSSKDFDVGDLSKNPFLNQAGLANANFGANAFGSQSGFEQNFANSNSKFGTTGYTGSSPRPFTASGSNVNLIQNSQKNEFDYEQQTIDEGFRNTGNVLQKGIESGGDLQQTCAGQGYVCVLKSQCNNGVVNTNGVNLIQPSSLKQYCNVRTEICCRIGESGINIGADAQGSNLFVSQAGASQNDFQASFGQNTGFGQSTTGAFGTTGSGINRGISNSGSVGSFGTGLDVTSGSSSNFDSRTNSFNNFGGVGSTVAPTPGRFGSTGGINEVFKSTSQSNFAETDTFSTGTNSGGVYRPGAVGLKPGIPYLPPVDTVTAGSNSISSTAFTTPRPTFTTPGYLPPIQGQDSYNHEERVTPYPDTTGGIILDVNRLPNPTFRPPVTPVITPNDIPSGCAAALKCTPIEFCTAEGVISNTTVILTKDQESYRVPLTNCKDQSGRVGKCCRDPLYSDPWPTNQLGKWVPGVFGGNDGKYVPDSRVSPNNPRPQVTLRPPTTGSVYLNPYITPTPKYTPNQIPVTVSPTLIQKDYAQGTYSKGGQGVVGQGEVVTQTQRGRGQYEIGGNRQVGQVGQTQFAQGQGVRQGSGFIGTQGGGFGVTQDSGFGVTQGSGAAVSRGVGFGVSQGSGQGVRQGAGFALNQGSQSGVQDSSFATSQDAGFSVGTGQGVIGQGGSGSFGVQGAGQSTSQGFGLTSTSGQRVNQGQGSLGFGSQGFGVSQNSGFGIRGGGGQFGVQGFGQELKQGQEIKKGFGQIEITGQGQRVEQGFGQKVTQGFGQELQQGEVKTAVIQGFEQGVKQGEGFTISQDRGANAENDYAESIHRVYLKEYSAGGQAGVLNSQKPYGNRNNLEMDFAEIPWQAMVLLQTNKSLLCGGVITRPDVVLTTAACVDGLKAQNVLIKGGEWKLGVEDEPLSYQIVQVKHILKHPFYKTGSLKYDAAILVLTENLRFAKNIYPIALPGSTETLDAFYNGAGECIVTGWGKIVLQAHLQGAIMHGLNVSLLNPGECQAKLSTNYPHLLEQYDEDSCVCGQPTNPANSICKVDIGSALACTTDNQHYVLRGLYSWDSGCQIGNQIAGFFKFDLDWYLWAIGLKESVRFTKYTTVTQIIQDKYTGIIDSGLQANKYSGVKGQVSGAFGSSGAGFGSSGSVNQFASGGAVSGVQGFGSLGSQFSKFSQSGSSKFSGSSSSSSGVNFDTQLKGPISNTFSASYQEKKVYQSEPKFVTYTTKPEFVTYTTKPEYFTYTTKPKIVTYTTAPKIVTYTTKPKIITYTTKPEIVTYTTKPEIVTFTTKPQIIRYETSGSASSPQYAVPEGSINPSFTDVVGSASHTHTAQCKCVKGKK